MWAVARRTLKDRKRWLGIYIIAGALFMWMYVALFPTFADQAADFEKLLESYPEGLLAAFGIDEFSISQFESFLAAEHYSFVWPLMVIFMMISLAGTSFAGEVDRGTVELLLSRPISRVKLFFGRWIASVIALAIFTAGSVFSVVPLAAMNNVDIIVSSHVSMAMLGFLFGLAILSLGMMFSAFVSDKGRASFLTGGVLIVMYVAIISARLADGVEWLKHISFFHYYDQSLALVDNAIPATSWLLFIGIIVVTTIIGVVQFNRRDIAV